MKRILLTGGFGFIGSHLLDRLLNEGNQVHVVDNLSNSSLATLKELTNPRGLSCTISTVAEFFRASPDMPFDEIYHLASPVGPAGILKYAGQIVKQVVDDTDAVIQMAIKHKAKLVDVSTSEVYGGGQGGLCGESMDRVIQAETTVRLEYAIAKLAAETMLINMGRISQLQAVIIRPFNVAGPRQSARGGFVLPRFVGQAMIDDPLTVFGDGKQIRAFTHVADIVDGLMRAMQLGKVGEVYNLGNADNKITIRELAERVIDVTESRSKITLVDGKSIYGPLYAEAADKYPDSTKAIADLKWKPQFDIEQTIRDVQGYMSRRLQLAKAEVQ